MEILIKNGQKKIGIGIVLILLGALSLFLQNHIPITLPEILARVVIIAGTILILWGMDDLSKALNKGRAFAGIFIGALISVGSYFGLMSQITGGIRGAFIVNGVIAPVSVLFMLGVFSGFIFIVYSIIDLVKK